MYFALNGEVVDVQLRTETLTKTTNYKFWLQIWNEQIRYPTDNCWLRNFQRNKIQNPSKDDSINHDINVPYPDLISVPFMDDFLYENKLSAVKFLFLPYYVLYICRLMHSDLYSKCFWGFFYEVNSLTLISDLNCYITWTCHKLIKPRKTNFRWIERKRGPSLILE